MTSLDRNPEAKTGASVLPWITAFTTATAMTATIVLAAMGNPAAAVVAGIIGGLGTAGTIHVTINIRR